MWLERRGMPVHADNVILTAGAQHAASIVLAAVTSPGDVVLSEELTDPGIKLLCSHYRLNLHGIAIDEGGIVPAGLEQACRNAKVRALFCIPNHHSPTLSVMAEGRRKEIAAIAEAYDLAVIENDTYGGFLEKPPGALARYAPERSFYFTSLSKIISPGLRLGFLAAPSGKLAELTSGLGATCWMVPQISAEVGALWIREGTAEHLAAWQRKEMVQRHEIVRATLPAADFSALPSSLHVWLTLPDPWRAEGLAQQLRQRGVSVTPAEAFAVGQGAMPQAIRISLGGAAPSRTELRQCLEILAHTLAGRPMSSFVAM